MLANKVYDDETWQPVLTRRLHLGSGATVRRLDSNREPEQRSLSGSGTT